MNIPSGTQGAMYFYFRRLTFEGDYAVMQHCGSRKFVVPRWSINAVQVRPVFFLRFFVVSLILALMSCHVAMVDGMWEESQDMEDGNYHYGREFYGREFVPKVLVIFAIFFLIIGVVKSLRKRVVIATNSGDKYIHTPRCCAGRGSNPLEINTAMDWFRGLAPAPTPVAVPVAHPIAPCAGPTVMMTSSAPAAPTPSVPTQHGYVVAGYPGAASYMSPAVAVDANTQICL
eukprot:g78337.t1